LAIDDVLQRLRAVCEPLWAAPGRAPGSHRGDTGWAGVENPLGRLILYLTGSANMLINDERRRAQGRPISSAGADCAVDYVIGQRMKRSGHMRWSQEGANALLRVRCAVLDGQDVRNFVRSMSIPLFGCRPDRSYPASQASQHPATPPATQIERMS
jgi:hypothetical protein